MELGGALPQQLGVRAGLGKSGADLVRKPVPRAYARVVAVWYRQKWRFFSAGHHLFEERTDRSKGRRPGVGFVFDELVRHSDGRACPVELFEFDGPDELCDRSLGAEQMATNLELGVNAGLE